MRVAIVPILVFGLVTVLTVYLCRTSGRLSFDQIAAALVTVWAIWSLWAFFWFVPTLKRWCVATWKAAQKSSNS